MNEEPKYLPVTCDLPYRDWSSIGGWFDEEGPYFGADAYRELIAAIPDGGRMVEVGSWMGKSTVCAAQLIEKSGKKVYFDSIDTFNGLSTTASDCNTREYFDANLEDFGVKLSAVRQLHSTEAAKLYEDGSLDAVYIDAGHDYDAVYADLEAWLPKVKVGGVIAGHDYDKRTDAGVCEAVDTFFRERNVEPIVSNRNWSVVKTAVLGSNGHVHLPQRKRPTILLCMPASRNPDINAAKQLWRSTCMHAHVAPVSHNTSLLARNFNILWQTALTQFECGAVTHFAMLHDDVVPCEGWLDILWDEMVASDADMISAVVPIKDSRGLSSTAIADPDNRWNPAKRLTMTELAALPGTFTAADCGFPGRALLLNTGCWLVDFRRPFWSNAINALKNSDGVIPDGTRFPFFFTVNDDMVRQNGIWVVKVESEDWLFSRLLHAAGAKLVATKKVITGHIGTVSYPSDHAWGTDAEDEQGSIADARRKAAAQSELQPTQALEPVEV